MPLQVQPAIFTMLALVTWAQCVYYNPPFAWVRRWHVPLFTVTLACTFAGVETALVLTLRPLDSEAKVIAVGVVATVALMSGLVPPYIELAKRRGRVVGINFLFLATDWCGAAFSLMSLVAQRKLDVLGSVMYIAVLVLEAGIFISHLVWRVRFREERREEKRLEKEAKRLKKEEKERAKRAGRDSPVIEGGDLEKAIGLEDA